MERRPQPARRWCSRGSASPGRRFYPACSESRRGLESFAARASSRPTCPAGLHQQVHVGPSGFGDTCGPARSALNPFRVTGPEHARRGRRVWHFRIIGMAVISRYDPPVSPRRAGSMDDHGIVLITPSSRSCSAGSFPHRQMRPTSIRPSGTSYP